MKKGVSPPPSAEAALLICERKLLVPIVLEAVGEGVEHVSNDPVRPLNLGVGVLVVC